MLWYGNVQDITNQIDYMNGMGEIVFDLSHVLRGPVTRILGLTELIDEESVKSEDIKMYVKYIKNQITDLEVFTRELNDNYQGKWDEISQKSGCLVDISNQFFEEYRKKLARKILS